MKQKFTTCLECGNVAVPVGTKRLGPRMYRKGIKCEDCGQEGRLFGSQGDAQDEIKEGNFAILSSDGLETLRSNL